MINWKYKLVTMEDKEKQMNKTKLRGEKRNKIKKRYPWQDRYGPYSNSGVDLTTYTEFEDLSRLSMSHYRVLADGTKLCSKHNDITFDKAMREKIKEKEIIYIQQHSSHYQMDIQLLKNLLDLLCQCNVQMI